MQRSRDAHLEKRQSSRKSPGVPTPSTTFTEPTRKLSGDLKILMWSHFVPAADQWFDPFVQEWGKQVGVNVTVDHINQAEIPARTAAEIQAKQGHDLIQYIATFSQFEPSVVDLKDVVQEAEKRHGKMLDVVRKSSFNPNTNKYYAYSPAWAPDPGDYRKSMWEKVGLPNGPTTWDELLRGGAEIKKSQGVQMGIGMSQEIDSNMAGRALLWSFGGSIQDENEKVVINSPETVAAVEFMTRLYKESMTPEVFSWNAASNNQGLVAGQMSYILNSISAWRTAQSENPSVADDISFVKALKGPKTARCAARHVQLDRPVVLAQRRCCEGIPASLHRESAIGDLPVEALRLPRVPRCGAGSGRLAGQGSVRRQPARQARRTQGFD